MYKPILFNGEMVRAILDGRKTETRRIVKGIATHEGIAANYYGNYSFTGIEIDPDIITEKKNIDYETAIGTYANFEHSDYAEFSRLIKSPYQVDDILWIRETWARRIIHPVRYYYRADNNIAAEFNRENNRWRPSIHMPRAAARIFLQVTSVTCERLHELTLGSIRREGMPKNTIHDEREFKTLWDSTVQKPEHKFSANPYVWVYTFRTVPRPADFGGEKI